MEKVKKFKELCSEMERREKNLNEELKEYIQKANNVCKLGGFVSYEDKIIDPFDSIPDELKKNMNIYFRKYMNMYGLNLNGIMK